MPAYSGTQRTTMLPFGMPGQPYGSFANKTAATALSFSWPVVLTLQADPTFTLQADPLITLQADPSFTGS